MRRDSVPLPHKFGEVVIHVRFKLSYVLGGEGVRDGFPLASVLCSIASVEKTSLDGDEGIVVITAADQLLLAS